MDYESAKRYLDGLGQAHLLEYYGELSDGEREELLNDVQKTDFSIIEHRKHAGTAKRGKLSPVSSAVTAEEVRRNRKSFEEAGLKPLSAGKVAAVLLAGGQGSRLGFDGPKGTFNIGLTRELSIFEQQMNNIKDVTDLTGKPFPLFVMTSVGNNGDTVKFFKEHNYFGYPSEKIHFFVQDVAPACDFDGKVFLDKKNRISLTPNGNGGWYTSLISSGLDKVLEREKIEWLNVYSVDNVLQRICDPAFIGATVLSGCRCGAKVVRKVSPEEKVGVLCREDGKPAIVEYFELPDKLKNERVGGELVYCYGVTLNYLFNVGDLNSTLSGRLPYHVAEKAVAHVENGQRIIPDKPCGYKFETLVVDMVKLMGSCLAYEVEREKEFAPVKNATGTDSVETARELLKKNGVKL